MTQLELPPESATLTDRIAQYFRSHPGEWISMQALAEIGGTGGWRTRVSDCRRQRGMRIVNRTYRSSGYTVSMYRYEPPDAT